MSEYTVTMSFSGVRSRILVTAGRTRSCGRCCQRPGKSGTRKAALSFLESLALWLDQSPRVVVSAAEWTLHRCSGSPTTSGRPSAASTTMSKSWSPKPAAAARDSWRRRIS